MGTDLRTVTADLKKGLAPVYLLEGAERLLVDEALKKIVAAGCAEDPGIAVQRLDLSESSCDARKILAECQSMGLFTTRNLVVLRAAELLDMLHDLGLVSDVESTNISTPAAAEAFWMSPSTSCDQFEGMKCV